MAIDPGKTTGVAQAMLNARRAGGSTRDLMRRAVEKDALRVSQLRAAEAYRDGPFDSTCQGVMLARAWCSFQAEAVLAGIPYGAHWLVIERFQLRQRDAELQPVEVTHALLACLASGSIGNQPDMGWSRILRPDCIVFQEPSMAMTYATNDRLRDWGVWTIGAEHGRDATRHLCLTASRVLQGELYDRVR